MVPPVVAQPVEAIDLTHFSTSNANKPFETHLKRHQLESGVLADLQIRGLLQPMFREAILLTVLYMLRHLLRDPHRSSEKVAL